MIRQFFLGLTLLFMMAASHTVSAATGPLLVFDVNSGKVIVANRAGEPWYPASLTKLMTAYITFKELRAKRLTLQTRLKVSKHAASRPPSKIGIRAGNTVSVDFALKAILIHSANDMAEVLAENISGSIAGFAKRMNREAARLGMTGTNFVNPHGLYHKSQVTTARDLGILAATIIREFPQYHSYFITHNMRVGKRTLKNRNKLMTGTKWVDGMKTGYLCASGYNLVASARVNGRRLVSVALGAHSSRGRNELSKLMLEWSSRYAGSKRLANLRNQGGRPKDIRQVVCVKPKPVLWGNPNDLDGWGVSLGRYKSAYTADAVLKGRVLTSRNYLGSGKQGVFRAPPKSEYIALLSRMDQQHSQSLCNYLRRTNAHCEVLSPQSFATFRQIRAAAKSKTKTAGRKKTRKVKNNWN